MLKRAIVLSGGGSKGAYQVGAWKALRRLKIKYDIVTGTSIGAINGAFFVMKDYKRAYKLWFNADYNIILDEKMKASYDDKYGKGKVFGTYLKGALKGGLSVGALEKSVNDNINVNKFFKSKIDYGLVTVKVPLLRPCMMRKKDLTKENLKDYIVASASCFPAFKKKSINDASYIDGGFFDNMPINLAIDMGADEVIAINLRELGTIKKVKNTNIPITVISPNNDIGNFLVIEKQYARRAINFGYNDTMKVFHKLDGNYFTFKKNHLKKCFEKYKNRYYNNFIMSTFDKETLKGECKNILNGKFELEVFCNIMEETGKIFELQEDLIYNYALYNKSLIRAFDKSRGSKAYVKEVSEKSRKPKIINHKTIIKYMYQELKKSHTDTTSFKSLIRLFPKDFLMTMYFYTIID